MLSGRIYIALTRCTGLAIMLLCLNHTGLGQVDSSRVLRQIEVTAERLVISDVGKHADRLDSISVFHHLSQNLSSRLSRETPLYVRSYGNGTLATLGIRGGSAAHTQVMWNGIPIRNPMLGMVDLALIPSVFFDQATIHYGGHGAAFGSGAVGGLISFSNTPLNDKSHIELRLQAGRWKERAGMIKLDYGFPKIRFSTRLSSFYAQNNYKYNPGHDLDARYQSHHEIKEQGILQEVRWALTDKEKITARAWYQFADRQIPPTSVQTTSKEAQQDKSLRASLHWEHNGDQWRWQIKSAFLDEDIHYQDSLILLYTENKFRTWIAEGTGAVSLYKNVDLTGGLYLERVKAFSDNYIEALTRHQEAAYVSLRWTKSKWMWRVQAREEMTDGDLSPLLVDFASEWSPVPRLTLKASLSRNYRVPTMNDLYWRPGGNPDLEPEQGWTIESGAYFRMKSNRIDFRASMTGYYRNLKQWIMWMPPVKDLRTYWSPVNVGNVISRGMEWRTALGWTSSHWSFLTDIGMDFTWSTFGQDLPEFKIEKGDQLFYVPVTNIQSRFEIGYDGWSWYYQHHWFGSSPGINDMVEAANIGATGLGYRFVKTSFEAALFFEVSNLWNVPYRLIERRPMPGRGFEIGLNLKI